MPNDQPSHCTSRSSHHPCARTPVIARLHVEIAGEIPGATFPALCSVHLVEILTDAGMPFDDIAFLLGRLGRSIAEEILETDARKEPQ